MKRFALSALLALIVALTIVTPVFADGGDIKRACTVNDNWFTKLFDPCAELEVSAPTVVTIDVAKWEKALNDAEAYLRSKANGNQDPVDDSNIVSDTAWRYYCDNQTDEPAYDVTGNPVCK